MSDATFGGNTIAAPSRARHRINGKRLALLAGLAAALGGAAWYGKSRWSTGPSVNLGLDSLPPERLKYASGLFNMMRNLGGAVGIAIAAAILNDRTNAHFLMIASNLTPANGGMNRLVDTMGQRLASHETVLKHVWPMAYAQASTLSYADAFRAIMLAFVFATLLVPLMRKVAPAKKPTNAH